MIFIFPTKEEAQRFISLSPTSHIEISGVGAAACGAAVAKIAQQHPHEMIILAGIAGTYDSHDVDICEVVEVTSECIESLPQKYRVTYTNTQKFSSLRSASSNCVNSNSECATSAQIENMEGAALFATCQALGVEFAEIRAISNRVGKPFSEWHIDEAIESLTDALLKISR